MANGRTLGFGHSVLEPVKTRTSGAESAVGCTLAAGVGFVVIGGFCCWLFASAGVYRGTYTRDVAAGDKITDAGMMNYLPLALLVIFVGLAMVVGALVYGNLFVRAGHKGPRQRIDQFRIIARFPTDRNGHVISEWQIDGEDRVKFYVRGALPDGQVDEFEVSETVYLACGEGMVGIAEVQGRWIGSFLPYVGGGPAPVPYQDGLER